MLSHVTLRIILHGKARRYAHKNCIYNNNTTIHRHYRRKILIALGSNLDEEFEYTEKMALSNPKNYQIWHHRREICQLLNDGSREKAFCAQALEEDAKNYHAWAHRQWVIQTFHLFESELDFVNEMLTKDIRNNSAWNHRWFVLKHTNKNDLLNNNLILRQKEMDFAFEKIHLAVHNESAWNFVRGLLLRGKNEQAFFKKIQTKCLEIYREHSECIYVASLLVDLYTFEGSYEAAEMVSITIETMITK
jgi:protein farnesyltransferase/geranylgeranyltransferase type-1 subunit alpha